MNITQTPIWDEIQRIRLTGEKPVHFQYKAKIRIGETGDEIEPMDVTYIDVGRDYHTNLSDVIRIGLSMGRGTFDSKVYPYRESLTVSIYKYPLYENETAENENEYETYIYRAVVFDDASGTIAGDTPFSATPDILDRHSIEDYDFQLVDRAVEQLRFIGVSGIYHDITPGDCLKGLLTIACTQITGLSIDEEILGVDMVEPSNTTIRRHCVVDQVKSATSLAKYMQEEEGGVYSFGMGSYIQNKLWYIYPQYHLKRFSEEVKTLTVLNIPKDQMPGIERTYFTDGSKVIVISTGETIHKDDSESRQMNEGNGMRFAVGSSMVPYSRGPLDYKIPFRTIRPDKDSFISTAVRKKNTEEVIFTPRKDGFNFTPVIDKRITDNPYHEESKVCMRFGGHVFATWENSDPDLLYPGMPVKYMYMENEELVELNGILMGNSHKILKKGKGMIEKRYMVVSQVHIFIETIPK